MKFAQLDRFDRFFDENYPVILAEITGSDPSGAKGRTRAGFASAYRFWSKVEDDGDQVGWIRRVIAEDRRSAGGAHGLAQSLDESGRLQPVDLRDEHRRIVALARRQRAGARVVIGASAFLAVSSELFVAHR